MTRSLTFAFAGLVAAVSLSVGSDQAEARYGRRYGWNHCCQQASACGCQQYGARYHRHNGYYAQSSNGCVGTQQTVAYAPANSYVTPTTYAPAATTACCAPQPTCCGGIQATASPVTPASYTAPQPPVFDNAPAPISGN